MGVWSGDREAVFAQRPFRGAQLLNTCVSGIWFVCVCVREREAGEERRKKEEREGGEKGGEGGEMGEKGKVGWREFMVL